MHDHTHPPHLDQDSAEVLRALRLADLRHRADRRRDAGRLTLLALALLGLEAAAGA